MSEKESAMHAVDRTVLLSTAALQVLEAGERVKSSNLEVIALRCSHPVNFIAFASGTALSIDGIVTQVRLWGDFVDMDWSHLAKDAQWAMGRHVIKVVSKAEMQRSNKTIVLVLFGHDLTYRRRIRTIIGYKDRYVQILPFAYQSKLSLRAAVYHRLRVALSISHLPPLLLWLRGIHLFILGVVGFVCVCGFGACVLCGLLAVACFYFKR
eukprot:4125147-Amphidinium_carterae.1